MRSKKLFLHGLAAAACLIQVSCEVGGPAADLKYPTVSELDAADQRWGLPARKSKGGSKRTFQYQTNEGGGGVPVAPAPVAAAPETAPPEQAPIPAKPDPQIDVSKLR